MKIKKTVLFLLASCLVISSQTTVLQAAEKNPAASAYKGNAGQDGQESDNNDKDNVDDSQSGGQSRIPDLKPGQWEPLFSIGRNLFPSVVICTATLTEGGWDHPEHIGDGWGTIGIAVSSPKNNCPITVEISGGSYIKPTAFNTSMPGKGITYRIFPNLKYDYDKLLSIRQTTPENLVFKVRIDGKEESEKLVRIQVRSINECVFYFVDYTGDLIDCSWFFAAYVNENHPVIDQILKDAITSGRIDGFAGYGNDDQETIMKEIEAIWDTLKDKGIHYSSITTTADDDDPEIGDQHIRLLGESLNYSQANCVDGSVLLASILRKIGLDVDLIILPTHMFISVCIDPKKDDYIFIETTMLGNSSLEDAIESGNEQYSENEAHLNSDSDEDKDYSVVNIKKARAMGIMPIKESPPK